VTGRRVFVSGGAGVIGCELVPMLVARGATVLVGDLKPRPPGFDPAVGYRQGDLSTMTADELAGFAPDLFVHLAATFERSTESPGFWDENFHHNVALSHHLMTLARDLASLRRVVFASSYLIYEPALYQFAEPRAAATSLREDHPIQPRNLTGMAKLAHEVELRFLAGLPGTRFSSVCARIFRGYGRGSRDVVSRWVRSLLADEPIAVFRPEGMFDYVYARDSAEGLIRLAEAEATTGVVNLGTGRAHRVAEVVRALRAHFPAMVARDEPSDIPFEASQADLGALRRAIGWSPSTPLAAGIGEIVAYERARRTAPAGPARAPNVLVTSAARKVPLVRAMQTAARTLDPASRVVAGDVDPRALTRHVADAFWAMPRTDEAALDALLEGCRARAIGVVVPTRDGELAFWAAARERFARAGVEVVVASVETVARCLDKLAFARFGAARGLPFIPAAEHPDELGPGPYVVKERRGAGSRRLGLGLDRAAALAHGATLDAPIYQPFVDGPELSVDAWMDRGGVPRGVVLRRRDVVVDGESQVTTTFRDPALETAAVAILRALELRGPAVMQAIHTPDGLRVIEVNARFGGASTASIAVGLDLLYWSLLEAHDPAATPRFARAAREVRQVRLPADILVHDPGV
jgi:carbamoyl-phosphate synthase large subunit